MLPKGVPLALVDKSNGTFKGTARNPLAERLLAFADLSNDDLRQLDTIEPLARDVPRNADIVLEGDPVEHLPLVERGWIAQYRLLHDGRRCVLRFNIPGDVIDGTFPLIGQAQYSAQALTDARLQLFPAMPLAALLRCNARIATAFLMVEGLQHSFLREHVTALARLNAYERLGHLCLELLLRLESVGLAEDNEFRLPVSQSTLGDALGIHEIHVNRVFRRLVADGQIERRGNLVRIPDRDGLARLVEFRGVDVEAARAMLRTSGAGLVV